MLLVIEVFGYFTRRLDRRSVYLSNFVSESRSHGSDLEEPSVVIIIPSRNKHTLLKTCIDSIVSKTTYRKFEIVVVNNQSNEPETLTYLDELRGSGMKVLDFPHPFNYSAICNYAVEQTKSEFVCLLNNDTEILDGEWLGNLVAHTFAPGAGVVGGLLSYPDGSVQHAGVALGLTGAAGHALSGDTEESTRNQCYQVSAVTFACAMFSRRTFELIGGLDENYPVGLNDVDFCLRAASAGLRNTFCGKTCLIHHESKSRPRANSFQGAGRATIDVLRFLKKWGPQIREDTFFTRIP